jgi:curved DNA-binding protein CbpA
MTRRKQIRYDPTNDLYVILGVQASASITEIHRAYRKRAKEVHPDLNRERLDWAHAQFQLINDAHDILGDPDLRSEYDTKRFGYAGIKAAQKQKTNVSYQQASRAAWARRNRRQQPGAAFMIPLFITIFSCIMLRFSQDARGTITVHSGATSAVSAAIVDSVDPCNGPYAAITSPVQGEKVSLPFEIVGRATGDIYSTYSVMLNYRSNTETSYWISLVKDEPRRVEDSVLVTNSTTQLLRLIGVQGDITLRLTVKQSDGRVLPPCDVAIHLS